MNPRIATLSRCPPPGREPLVVCAGLVASDFLARVPFPVPRDVKVRVKPWTRQGGGPAANAACAVARLGGRAAFLGAVGEDSLGKEQVRALEAEGVDASGVVAVPGAPSFVSFILVDEDTGERTIFSSPEDRPLLPLRTSWPEPAPDLLLLDAWAGPAGAALAAQAHERGVPILLDAGTFTEETTALLPLVDVAIVSEAFAQGLAGEGGAEAAIALIAARGPRLVAVTRGARGAVAGVRGAEERFSIPAAPAGTIRDATGCGDAFHGGAAWALTRGRGWEGSLRFGAAVAALKCRRLGAREGLPTLGEVEELLARLTGAEEGA